MSDESDRATAAMRYKEIVGLARKAGEDLRTWELHRAAELDAEIGAAAADLTAATQREERVSERGQRWWRMARDNVSRLSWLDAGEEPEPVASARGEQLDRYVEDVRPAYHELTQAILNLGWRSR